MRARMSGLRTALVAVGGVTVLAVAADLAARQPAPPLPRAVRVTTTAAALPPDPPVDTSGTVPWWLVVVALALLALVTALLWSVLRDSIPPAGDRVAGATGTREDEHARRTADLATFADLALADAADDLASGADAREVVVACWVRIEQAAGAAGLGRRPAETATDVARRWLAGRPDRAAVDELAALYHLARYSTHPLTEVHRDRARAALRGALAVTP